MNKETRLTITIGGILGITIFLFFQFFYPYHLFFKEQMLLFLFTPDYILSYFSKPASLACLTGDFFTQFYYLRGGGAIILTCILIFEWLLLFRLIKPYNPKLASLLACFPVIIEATHHLGVFYGLPETFALIFAIAWFLFYRGLKNRIVQFVIGVISIPILYWLAGGSLLLFVLLLIIDEFKRKQKNWIYILAIGILFTVLPVVYRRYFLLTLSQSFLYPYQRWSELLPTFITFFIFIFIFSLYSPFQKLIAKRYTLWGLMLVLLGVTWVGITKKANFTREKILSLDSEAYFLRWNKVYELAEEYKDLNLPTITYYTNLALSHKGELTNQLLDYYQPGSYGLFLTVGPEASYLNLLFSGEVYFHLGDMNMAQHSAMLGKIFSPHNRSSRMIKRLVEINLINEDIPATEKYLKMLDKTLMHSKWAKQHKQLLYTPSENIPLWLKQKRDQRATFDTIRRLNNYPLSLEVLVESNPDNQLALDYLLCFHLLNKDISSFVITYDRYMKNKTKAVPRLYQEILLISLISRKATENEVREYRIPNDLIKEFVEYTQIYESNGGRIEPLQERFRYTYWFYFHFAQITTK